MENERIVPAKVIDVMPFNNGMGEGRHCLIECEFGRFYMLQGARSEVPVEDCQKGKTGYVKIVNSDVYYGPIWIREDEMEDV